MRQNTWSQVLWRHRSLCPWEIPSRGERYRFKCSPRSAKDRGRSMGKWQWVQRGEQMNSVMWHNDSSPCQPMYSIVAPRCYNGVKNFPQLGGIIAIGLWLVEHRFELLPSRLSAILLKFRTGTIGHGKSLGWPRREPGSVASLDSCRVPDGTYRTGALRDACDVTCAEGEHGHSLAVRLGVQIDHLDQSRRDGAGMPEVYSVRRV